jgi:DNA-binding NarL/FixJ family response regulator
MMAIDATQGSRPRIVLADDYSDLLTAWRRLLEPSFEVVGTVRNGRALVDAVLGMSPQLVIADLCMPEIDGLEACRLIKQARPDTRVILVTAGGNEWVARAAFDAGASAFVLTHSADDLLAAIHSALVGETFCTAAVGVESPRRD